MTFHYDENSILSWKGDLNAVNAQQNFSRIILVSFCSVSEVVMSDMFSHCLAVLKRSKDLT